MSLGWPGNASGSPLEELEEVSGVREVWASLLRLLPPRPGPWTKRMKKKKMKMKFLNCLIAQGAGNLTAAA
ncbi:hypothetical protein L3Q82_012064 [Scortum barcoo]|uniref:Uncharacterized protein n=1 Tax=Scortum barcoo TaxID=214431 RepID=A0ACB8W6T9_9TELE|nr:hypothetical protein L3Q82_012064 [Scortum barcoo]